MRLPTKSGFAMATILAASFGFAGLTHAAPLAGVAAAVPSVQMTQNPLTAEALPENAYHHPKPYYHHPKPYYHHPKPYYKKPPYQPEPSYPKKEEYPK
jgi:hypothetical protein